MTPTDVVAVSDWTKQYFVRKTGIRRVHTVVNGIDVDGIASGGSYKNTRADFGIGLKDTVFANVASFTEGKYQMCLIGVMETIMKTRADIKFVLVGNVLNRDYHRCFLDALSRSPAKKNIVLIDYIPQSEMGGFLRTIPDAFVLPSIHEAGVTLSVMEALLNRLPVAMTDFNVRTTFPLGKEIQVFPTPYHDIQTLTLSAISALARKVHAPNEAQLVATLLRMTQDMPRLKRDFSADKYRALTVENMTRQYLALINESAQEQVA